MRRQHARLIELRENIPYNLASRCHGEILALDGHEVLDGNSGMARDLPHDPATKIVNDVLTARNEKHRELIGDAVAKSHRCGSDGRTPKSRPVGAPAPRSTLMRCFSH